MGRKKKLHTVNNTGIVPSTFKAGKNSDFDEPPEDFCQLARIQEHTAQWFWCHTCKKLAKQPCWSHVKFVSDLPARQSELGLPLVLGVRSIEGRTGIFTKSQLPSQTVFGPLNAPVTIQDETSPDFAPLSPFSIPLNGSNAKLRKVFLIHDDTGYCNWMKNVRRVRKELEFNMVFFEFRGEIYFITNRFISANEELLICCFENIQPSSRKRDVVACVAEIPEIEISVEDDSGELESSGISTRLRSRIRTAESPENQPVQKRQNDDDSQENLTAADEDVEDSSQDMDSASFNAGVTAASETIGESEFVFSGKDPRMIDEITLLPKSTEIIRPAIAAAAQCKSRFDFDALDEESVDEYDDDDDEDDLQDNMPIESFSIPATAATPLMEFSQESPEQSPVPKVYVPDSVDLTESLVSSLFSNISASGATAAEYVLKPLDSSSLKSNQVIPAKPKQDQQKAPKINNSLNVLSDSSMLQNILGKLPPLIPQQSPHAIGMTGIFSANSPAIGFPGPKTFISPANPQTFILPANPKTSVSSVNPQTFILPANPKIPIPSAKSQTFISPASQPGIAASSLVGGNSLGTTSEAPVFVRVFIEKNQQEAAPARSILPNAAPNISGTSLPNLPGAPFLIRIDKEVNSEEVDMEPWRLTPKKPEKPPRARFECQRCSIYFWDAACLEMHNLKHKPKDREDTTQKTCPKCSYSRKKWSLMVKHVRRYAKSLAKTQCDICKKMVCVARLEQHKQTKHKVEGFGTQFECEICHKFFPSQKALRVHRHYCDPNISTRLQCAICLLNFPGYKDLWNHIEIHVVDDMFQCRLCNLKYKNYKKLRLHMRQAHSGKLFVCDICGKIATTQMNLTIHKTMHSNDYPEECEICKKKFKSKYKLNNHVNYVHLRTRPNSYERRKLAGTLNRDYRGPRFSKKYEEFPFKCEECRFGYTRRGQLQNHVRSVHPEKSMDSVPQTVS